MTTFRKSGSSLLIILLISSAATIIILTGAKALIDASRLTGARASAQLATSMAQTGIQDGLLLQRTGALNFEYGDGGDITGNTIYDMKSMRRGYAINTNCGTLTPDMPLTGTGSGAYDPDCPYYDFSVRRFVSAGEIAISSRSFPHNTFVSLAAPVNPGITLRFYGGLDVYVSRISYQYCDDLNCTVAGSVNDIVPTPQPFSIDIPSINKGIKIQVVYTAATLDHIEQFVTATRTGGNTTAFLFDKGYTTIDATGYAGGVQKSLLMRIYPGLNWNKIDSAKPGFDGTKISLSQIDFAQHFDVNGIITSQ